MEVFSSVSMHLTVYRDSWELWHSWKCFLLSVSIRLFTEIPGNCGIRGSGFFCQFILDCLQRFLGTVAFMEVVSSVSMYTTVYSEPWKLAVHGNGFFCHYVYFCLQ